MATIQKQGSTPNRSDSKRSDPFSGAANTAVSGTDRCFFVPDLVSALSIKAVLAGSAMWETESRKYVVRENSYLVVNREQPYSFVIDSAALTTTFSLFFQHGFVEEVHRVVTQPDSTLLDSPEAALSGSLIFRQRLEPEPSGVLAALRGLHDAQAGGQLSRTATEEAFLRIARTLVREFLRTDKAASRLSAVRASTRDELLRRVLRGRDCLLSRMDESVSIADAARAACISRYHFFRAFRAAFRVTPHQFLTTQRLRRARTLLAGGKHTVTDVCFESGFQSLASFSSLFRSHFGVSPQDVQRATVRVPACARPSAASTLSESTSFAFKARRATERKGAPPLDDGR
jgi:AraC-like DNA-binding protein